MPIRLLGLPRPSRYWWLDQILGSFYALLIVALVTALVAVALVAERLEHVTILYLVPVLVAALYWGVVPAIVAAIAGVAAPAFFFYPPIFDFRVRNHDQVIDLVLFVIVAIVTGQLAVRVRRAKMREQTEALRDALIGSVSHELHTPLAAIVGSASILADAPAINKDEQLGSLVRVVRTEADRLNDDIQNLLDATRISNDGVKPRFEWVDLQDIVNGAVARKKAALAGRPVTLTIADDLPLVSVDASLIEAAVGQVLENASKYSPAESPIGIAATEESGAIVLKVQDAGDGLPFGEQERIFERFYRGPRHTALSGSGLGLGIARAFVESCCGRIRAFSQGAGQGTVMRIDLPVKEAPAAEEDDDA